jgi:hypothetical protein
VSEMYNERVLDHYRNPRNKGHLAAPDIATEEYTPRPRSRLHQLSHLGHHRRSESRIVHVRFYGEQRHL